MRQYKVLVDKYNPNVDLAALLIRNFPEQVKKIRKGDTVLLKPNMFMVDKDFYTYPDLLLAVAKVFKELGARVIIAERLRAMEVVLKDYKDIGKYAEVKSFDDLPVRKVKIQDATSLRQEMEIPELIFECDHLIGVPQFRTHAGVLLSNALKNMVGILPGFTTRIIHTVGLTEAIVDINRIRQQDLVVSDLIVTIEGNYPIAGVPMHRNCIILGNNALATDWVAADLAGFNPNSVNYLWLAGQSGMGPLSINDIEIINDYEKLKFPCIKSGSMENQRLGKITHKYENACQECQRYSNSLIELLCDNGMSESELVIVSGPEALANQPGKDPRKLILVGNCTYSMRNKGIYIEGCPPRAIQGLAVLEWLQNNGNVNEIHQNQCRWPNLR